MTWKSAEAAVDAFVQVVTKAAKRGDEVKIPGFGSFVITERAERQGKNPQTGQLITIPARKVVAFRAGKSLKEAVSG
ncbi:MAG: HU family DNA-binding protein [Moorella sp. (in: Bacteria)]|nr:HU family DNA-binding protein [Moorella sp. (in: firmicutes)]